MGSNKNSKANPGTDVAVVQPETATPKRFYVLLLNDDYTPMDFVVEVLERFFAMPNAQAVEVMWSIHTEGQAICGIYPQDIAETKVMQVSMYVKNHQHPLLCLMEPE